MWSAVSSTRFFHQRTGQMLVGEGNGRVGRQQTFELSSSFGGSRPAGEHPRVCAVLGPSAMAFPDRSPCVVVSGTSRHGDLVRESQGDPIPGQIDGRSPGVPYGRTVHEERARPRPNTASRSHRDATLMQYPRTDPRTLRSDLMHRVDRWPHSQMSQLLR